MDIGKAVANGFPPSKSHRVYLFVCETNEKCDGNIKQLFSNKNRHVMPAYVVIMMEIFAAWGKCLSLNTFFSKEIFVLDFCDN
jgi:hypothetical protein